MAPPPRRLAPVSLAALALPLIGFFLLLSDPSLDFHWEHHPSHFWLVLAAALINAVLAYVTAETARRRGDARVFLVSMTFLSSAGFLGLHALATPGVLLETRTAGFEIATPVGLAIAAAFAALSAAPLEGPLAKAVMRQARTIELILIAAMLAWAALSLATVPPLDDLTPEEQLNGPPIALAVIGVALYALAGVRYFQLYRERPSPMLLSVAASFALLSEAMIAVAFARNWHATWWEWHLLMLAAFALVALGARSRWREERFSDLYLEETAAGRREVSVVFADLAGFTAFSDGRDPREVSAMLNAYFEVAVPPIVKRHGGEIDQLLGDAIMATFNTRGDQPDHAERAARAALDIQAAAAGIAREHPDWPRFRAAVNTGEVIVGLIGAEGGRSYTVIGDTVNMASRLEGIAPQGRVAIGAQTLRKLPGARVSSLGPVPVKGKQEPIDAYLLDELPGP
jgi:adenylate cyclase